MTYVPMSAHAVSCLRRNHVRRRYFQCPLLFTNFKSDIETEYIIQFNHHHLLPHWPREKTKNNPKFLFHSGSNHRQPPQNNRVFTVHPHQPAQSASGKSVRNGCSGSGEAVRVLRGVPQQPNERVHPHPVRVANRLHGPHPALLHAAPLLLPLARPFRSDPQLRLLVHRHLRTLLRRPRHQSRLPRRPPHFPLLARLQLCRQQPRILARLESCVGCSVVLLDWTVHWSWRVRETCTSSLRQPCSSFSNGSFLCVA